MIATVDLFEVSNFDYTATPLRDERLLELRAHQDETYEHLKTTIIKDGWPDKLTDQHPDLETFWNHRESLSINNDGFIIKNGWLLVPAGLCQTYLQRLLAMHQQAEMIEARARRLIWWPFITQDIKNISKTFLPCQEKLPSQAGTRTRRSLLPVPLPAHGSCEQQRKTVFDSNRPIFQFPSHLRVRKTRDNKTSHGLHHAVLHHVQRARCYLQRRRSTVQRWVWQLLQEMVDQTH
jgi:hypothetical protein